MLAAVPGIAANGAEALLRRFGTVRAVVNPSEAEFLSVPGIGPKKAAALTAAILHSTEPF